MRVISINLPLQLNLHGTALKPRCLEQCVSLHINYCASVYFLCGLPNSKNHFNQIYRVQNMQCTFQRFVCGTILLLYQIQISAMYAKFRSCPCGRNVVDRFVIGKKISNTFPGFSDSKSQTIIQDISTESEKNGDYTNLFFRYLVILEVRDSLVGIATRYGLEGPGIESRCQRDLLHPSRLALGPTQPPGQ